MLSVLLTKTEMSIFIVPVVCLYFQKYFSADNCAIICAFYGCYCFLIVDFLKRIVVSCFATELFGGFFVIVEVYVRFDLEYVLV